MTQSENNNAERDRRQYMALWLRLGLGTVFVIGGCSKLSQLLDVNRSAAIVEQYMGPAGYINTFFTEYLFAGPLGYVLSPWGFLTALSSFELLSGLFLLAGFLVRPLALIYAFLLWTFVFSLPVVTTPGVDPQVATYTAPALFVQARDIALSGLMFVLFNLGSGRYSVDKIMKINVQTGQSVSFDALALLSRLSLAAPLLVGGFFAGMSNIQSFALPGLLLIIIGAGLLSGIGLRSLAIAAVAAMLWYMMTKLSMDKSLIANLNGFKREFALAAGYGLLAFYGGGNRYVWWQPTRDVSVADGHVGELTTS